MSDAHGVARDQLRAFVERIERLEEEKKTIADDIKDVYGEAKSMGFDTKILKKVIALRKKDEQERTEEEMILDTYLQALGMIPQFEMFEQNEVRPSREERRHVDPRLIKQVVVGMQTEAGRAALTAAVDIMIAREEAEEQNAPERPSENDEPSPEAGPQAEASPAGTGAGTLADREGRHEGEAVSADLPTISESAPATQGEAEAPSVERVSPQADEATTGSAAANTGGDHVTAHPNNAATADGLVRHTPSATAPKTAKDYRPNCLKPDACGASGLQHCYSCRRAMQDEEAA